MKPLTRAHARKAWRVSRQRWRQTATGRLRPLPSFLVIGAQKCGTTSLHDYLAQHPQIRAGRMKEVQFFDLPERYALGPAWYRSHFPLPPLGRPGPLVFESTPNYLFRPDVPARVQSLLPDVRLIALLRDPVARAVSAYHHEVRKGREHLGLMQALLAERDRIAEPLQREDYSDPALRNFSYQRRGYYAEQLDRYLQFFDRDQLLVLRSEDLFADPVAVAAQITTFLGLEPMPTAIPFPRLNTARKDGGGSSVPDDARQLLAAHFAPLNAQLDDLLGRSMGWDETGS